MGKFPAFAIKKTDLYLFKNYKIMTKVIIASVIMASVIASVTFGKCYLWQRCYGKCNYGKSIMANETGPKKSGPCTKKF